MLEYHLPARLRRRIILAVVAACGIPLLPAGSGRWAGADESVPERSRVPDRPAAERILAVYCLRCHGTDNPKSNFSLAGLVPGKPVATRLGDWRNILERLEHQDMPPKGGKRPSAPEYEAVVSWLRHEIEQVELAAAVKAGRPLRRLNRAEYNNTVRDLLGIDYRPADTFPVENGRDGFDNIADAQTISPLLLEKYLVAARAALEHAVVRGPQPPRVRQRFLPMSKAMVEGTVPLKPSPLKLEQLSVTERRRVALPVPLGVALRDGRGDHGYALALPRAQRSRFSKEPKALTPPVKVVRPGRYQVCVQAYVEKPGKTNDTELMRLDVNGLK